MKLPKIIKILFLSLFLLQLLGLAVLLVLPQLSQAADIEFTPQVSIGTEFAGKQTIGETTIGEYIQAIYKYAIGAVGILATVVLMFGGILWLTAGGNQERVTNAKSWITASLTGLVLTLCSYLILATVNPALTTFAPIKVATVMAPGCCTYTENGASKTKSINETDCKTKKGTYNSSPCGDSSSDSGCCEKEGGAQEMARLACSYWPGTFFENYVKKDNKCVSPEETGEVFCMTFAGCIKKQRDTCGAEKEFSTRKECLNAQSPECSSGTDGGSCNSGNGYCENYQCKSCLTNGQSCSHNIRNYECCASTEKDCNDILGDNKPPICK